MDENNQEQPNIGETQEGSLLTEVETTKRPRQRRMKITNEKFVDEYGKCLKNNDGITFLSLKLRLSYAGVLARIKTLRKIGVNLPDLAKVRITKTSKPDVNKLNSIIAQYLPSP